MLSSQSFYVLRSVQLGVSPTKVRKVPQKGPSNAKPFGLRFKLASSLQSHRRLLLLTFVPAACFSGSCRKAYPKAFWHRGAPCSPRASRKFGLIYQGSQWILSCWIRARSRYSGSDTTLRGGLPCREPAGVSRCGGPRLGDFLAAHQPAGRV